VLLLPNVSFGEESANSRPRVAVFSILFTGNILEPIRERVLARLYRTLEDQEIEVIDHQEVVEALDMDGPPLASTCRSGQCIRWIFEACGADAGLTLRVNTVENSYIITIQLHGPQGEEIEHYTQRCDICTFDEFEEAVAEVAAGIEVDVPHSIRPGRLDVAISPDGANVSIDGVEVGIGDLFVPLPPGRHVVEARLDGYEIARREVDVSASRTTRLEIQLFEASPAVPEPRQSYRAEPWLWISLVLGVVATVTGGVLFGLAPVCEDGGGIDGDCLSTYEGVFPWATGLFGSGLAMTLVSAISLAVLDASIE